MSRPKWLLLWLSLWLLVLLCVGSQAHAADQKLVKAIIQCESSGRTKVWGDDHVSYGIAQFRKETFYEFAAMARLKHADIKNPKQQVYLLNWGLDHSYGNRWTCYRKIKGRK